MTAYQRKLLCEHIYLQELLETDENKLPLSDIIFSLQKFVVGNPQYLEVNFCNIEDGEPYLQCIRLQTDKERQKEIEQEIKDLKEEILRKKNYLKRSIDKGVEGDCEYIYLQLQRTKKLLDDEINGTGNKCEIRLRWLQLEAEKLEKRLEILRTQYSQRIQGDRDDIMELEEALKKLENRQ